MACYGACLKWLLPVLWFSDRWSRGTKLWERDWSHDWCMTWRDVNYLRSNNRREPTLFPGRVGSWKRDWERTSLTYNSLTTLHSRGETLFCVTEKGLLWTSLRSWRDFVRECSCFTRGFAAREFPRGLREGIWRLRRLLARSRIPPATQANCRQTCFWAFHRALRGP